MKLRAFSLTLILSFIVILQSCDDKVHLISYALDKDKIPTCQDCNPTPVDLEIPEGFYPPTIPADNQLTEEGIKLGRMLYYDPILSGDSSQACASCHAPEFAFTDNGTRFSTGIDQIEGDRNAPAVINVAWMTNLFWDGRVGSIEDQARGPVPNPIEMHLSWEDAVNRLNGHTLYPDLFCDAFCTDVVTEDLVVKAIAQFERTIISGNSKYDQALRGEVFLTDEEVNGSVIFFSEDGDCFHCHGTSLFTTNEFFNNGMDTVFTDLGLEKFTEDPLDRGKFKSPTLRNIEYTAPYMHDGRFATLEEVIDFYSEGVHASPTIDPLMKKVDQGGIQLTAQEKSDLIAFLKALSDPDFLDNPDFHNPF